MSVCPPDHLSVCPADRLCNRVLLWRNIGSSYFKQRLLLTFGVSLFWFMVIRTSSRSLKEKVQNLCFVHIFLMKKYWKFLFHTKVANDLRVCHDFDPKSFWQLSWGIICELPQSNSSLLCDSPDTQYLIF